MIAEEAGGPISGAKSLKITAPEGELNVGQARQLVSVRSGERYRFGATVSHVRGLGGTHKVEVRNLSTGNWLSSAWTWGEHDPPETSLVADSTGFGTPVAGDLEFQVESSSAALVDLEVLCTYVGIPTSSGEGLFDDISIVPGRNFSVFVAHGIDPRR